MPISFELDDVTFWSHLKQNLLSSSSSICILFFAWCAAPVLLFSALPRSLTFPSYTIMCVHIIQRGSARALPLIYIFSIFSFLFSRFFSFWLLSRSSLPVLRRPARVPGSKTCAVWACQHALLFSSPLLPYSPAVLSQSIMVRHRDDCISPSDLAYKASSFSSFFYNREIQKFSRNQELYRLWKKEMAL